MSKYRLAFMGVVLLVAALLACIYPPVEVTTWDAVPSWSNAGDRLTFASRGFGDSILLGLYMVDTTGENRVLLSPGGSHSTWLPGDVDLQNGLIDRRYHAHCWGYFPQYFTG